MKRENLEPTKRSVALLTVVAILAAPTGFAREIEEPAENPLRPLAVLFSENVGSTPRSALPLPGETDGGVGTTGNCGDSGHCSFTTCPDPDCEPGQASQCECEASGDECEEDHSVWPGGEDSHSVFGCKCSCGSGEEPPEPPEPCTVYNPLTGNCLVDPMSAPEGGEV